MKSFTLSEWQGYSSELANIIHDKQAMQGMREDMLKAGYCRSEVYRIIKVAMAKYTIFNHREGDFR